MFNGISWSWGVIAPVVTVVILTIGITDQIRLIIEHKSSKQVSLTRTTLGTLVPVAWLFYGLELNNFTQIVCCICQIVLGGALFAVIWHYRNRN
ncbi:MAG: SemiSWEET family transporter [bacterium]|nr:SemiSWEET family transporter [bacterium]